MNRQTMHKYLRPSFTVFFFMVAFNTALRDFLISDLYKQDEAIWRSAEEIDKLWLWSLAHTWILGWIITMLYDKFSEQASAFARFVDKNPGECPLDRGICFGLTIGLFMGIMDSRSFTYLPISLNLALTWFFSSLIEGVCIGMLLGAIRKKYQNSENA